MKTRLLVCLAAFVSLLSGIVSVQAQVISTVAGPGMGFGFPLPPVGDGSPATSATIAAIGPSGITTDATGNLYIADQNNTRIRMVNPAGIITTIAGGGFALGDGGPATAARLTTPTGVAVDGAGNIYIADNGANRIRVVTAATGIINTLAGTGAGGAPLGDGAAATAAHLNPYGIVVDASGNVYFSDQSNNRIRVISAGIGIINTIAGTGAPGPPFGDGGPALAGRMSQPSGIDMDASGNIYIADMGNNRIRMINMSSGIISTVAGNGTGAFAGDGAAATLAEIRSPQGVRVDASGNIYIADTRNNRIRVVDASTGNISTQVDATGVTGAPFGDGGLASVAHINRPADLAIKSVGNYYISDASDNRVRYVTNDIAPAFVGGATQSLTVCEGSGANNIDTLLEITDPDVGQPETWTVGTAPSHGTLLGTFTATSTGSTIVPTGLTYTPSTGFSGADVFIVKVSDGTVTTTTTVNVTVGSIPAVAPIVGNPSVCIGSPSLFTDVTTSGVWSSTTTGVATVTAGGTVTGVSPGTDDILYTVTNTCGTVSVTYPVTVNIIVIPSLDISSANGTFTCPGAIDLLTAVPVNEGISPVYQWIINSIAIPGATTSSYSYIPAPGDIIDCTLTSSMACASPTSVISAPITMDGGSSPVPAISISATGGTTSCSGNPVTFSGATVNAGGTPAFNWTVNGVSSGSANPFTYTPADGDIVMCVLTSSIPCATPTTATSNVITMTVHTSVFPTVNVSVNPGETICEGTNTTFTALPVFGGTAPDFTWTKNGINVATGPTYTYVPANDDHVFCTMHSNELCPVPATVVSSTITMAVASPVLPTVTIVPLHGTNIGVGGYDTLVARISGAVFPTYQWYVNGTLVPGANTSNFVYSGSAAGTALVTCVAGSGDACNTTATSNLVSISVGTTGVNQVGPEDSKLTIVPNPNNGIFTMNISSAYDEAVHVIVTNIVGEKVKDFTTATNKDVEVKLLQTPGIYFLSATTDHGKYVTKVLVN